MWQDALQDRETDRKLARCAALHHSEPYAPISSGCEEKEREGERHRQAQQAWTPKGLWHVFGSAVSRLLFRVFAVSLNLLLFLMFLFFFPPDLSLHVFTYKSIGQTVMLHKHLGEMEQQQPQQRRWRSTPNADMNNDDDDVSFLGLNSHAEELDL